MLLSEREKERGVGGGRRTSLKKLYMVRERGETKELKTIKFLCCSLLSVIIASN